MALGAFNGWATFAKFVGCDLALGYAMDKAVGSTEQRKEQIMERSISKGVFGSNGNVFEGFRKQANGLEEPGNTLQAINSQLSHKIKLPTKRYMPMAWTTNDKNNNPFPGFTPDTSFLNTNDKRKDPKYKDVPLIVAPGKEDAYLEEKAKHDAAKVKEAERIIAEKEQKTNTVAAEQTTYASSDNDEQAEQPQQANENGWEGLLANFGLDGFGDITHNLFPPIT